MEQLKQQKSIIKGFTLEEVAAKKKEELTKKAEAIKNNDRNLLNRKERLLEELDHIDNEVKDLQIKKMQYRIDSVNRVLDYLRGRATLLTPNDIGTYLCHCQNKLNGNLDGLELTLDFTSKEAHNGES